MDDPAGGSRGMRTVCHGCRTMREVVEHAEAHRFEARSMVVPGDGTVYRTVAAIFAFGGAVVETPCLICGESQTPGWCPGFGPAL